VIGGSVDVGDDEGEVRGRGDEANGEGETITASGKQREVVGIPGSKNASRAPDRIERSKSGEIRSKQRGGDKAVNRT
jgi:hypothetical protein